MRKAIKSRPSKEATALGRHGEFVVVVVVMVVVVVVVVVVGVLRLCCRHCAVDVTGK